MDRLQMETVALQSHLSRPLVSGGYRDMSQERIDFYIRQAEEMRSRELRRLAGQVVRALRHLLHFMMRGQTRARWEARAPVRS